MADLDLDAIEARANAAMLSPTGQQYDAGVVLSTDVPALVAEVRSLRTMRDAAWQHYDEQVAAKERAALEERDEALRHLTHAAAVEAALTSDLLAAHVEVEQLRVTRAAMEEELAKVLAAIALAGEEIERASVEVKRADRQRDDARAAIAAVREACVGVEDCDYATTVVANVLAALDVRHDPSATTTIPIDVAREHAWLASYALEMLVDTGDGTYHPIADALAKVRDLLDPSATTEGGAS